MIGFSLSGWASLEELERHIEKLHATASSTAARRRRRRRSLLRGCRATNR